jgi:hypothetical protein
MSSIGLIEGDASGAVAEAAWRRDSKAQRPSNKVPLYPLFSGQFAGKKNPPIGEKSGFVM